MLSFQLDITLKTVKPFKGTKIIRERSYVMAPQYLVSIHMLFPGIVYPLSSTFILVDGPFKAHGRYLTFNFLEKETFPSLFIINLETMKRSIEKENMREISYNTSS